MWRLFATLLVVAIGASHAQDCSRGVNLARGKNTAQSSTYSSGSVGSLGPGFAVDGNLQTAIRSPKNGPEKCTHTKTENNPWWRVDLGRTYSIGWVILTNRGDCCGNRLTSIEIRIGNNQDDKNGGVANMLAPGAPFGTQSQGKAKAYNVNGLGGRYVYIRLAKTNAVLTLCEVEVLEYCPYNCFNYALNQPVTSSSVGWGGLGKYAVDGDTDNNHNARSCYHSAWQSNPWLRIDLGTNRRISRVRITNRGDCCSSRINGFQIRLGNGATPGQYQCNTGSGMQTITGGATNDFDCSALGAENSVSRYVYIYLPGGRKLLQVCEVEVFDQCDYSLYKVNLARGKPTKQISSCCSGDSSRAVDGNRNSRYGSRSCTHTNNAGTTWWYVDLGREYEINQVGIQNRGDCCGSRLSTFQIRIGNRIDNNGATNPVCRTGQSLGQGRFQMYPCAYMRGRYVTIIKYNNQALTLCEVEVYGRPAANDALGKGVVANTTDPQYPPTNAVDFGIDSDLTKAQAKSTCTITKATNNPLIVVDLGSERIVTSINFIFPSTGSYRSDAKTYGIVFLTNDPRTVTDHRPCGNFSTYDGKSTSFNLVCNGGVTTSSGRYVVFQLAGVANRKLGVCDINIASRKMIVCNIPGRYNAYCRQRCPPGTGGFQCAKCPSGRAGKIFLFGTKVCIRPQGGGLYPAIGTRLEYTTNCSNPSTYFTVATHGAIQHVYSKFCLFPENGGNSAPPPGSKLVLSNKCSDASAVIDVDQVSGKATMSKFPDVCLSPIAKGVPKEGDLVTYASCKPAVGILTAWDIDATVVDNWQLALNIKTNNPRFFYNSPMWGNPQFFGNQKNPLSGDAWMDTYSNYAITGLRIRLGGKNLTWTLPLQMRGRYTLQELVTMGDIQLPSPVFMGMSNMFANNYPSGLTQRAYCTNFGFSAKFYTALQANMACQGLARIGATTSDKLTFGPLKVWNGRCLHISGGGFRKAGTRNLVTWSGCDDTSNRLYFYITAAGRWIQSRNGICITTNTGKATAGARIVTLDNCQASKLFTWEYDSTAKVIRPKGTKLCVNTVVDNPGNGATLILSTNCGGKLKRQYFQWNGPYNSRKIACQRAKPTSAEGIGLTTGCTIQKQMASGLLQSSSSSFQGAAVYVLGHLRCQNQASCNPTMGTCDCAAGWAGVSCELPCPTGRFGSGCGQLCQCQNNAKCNPFNGTCTCTAGWMGATCSVPCAGGTYGVGCKKCSCNSPGFATCNRFNGVCSCNAGYGGSACQFKCNDPQSPPSLQNKWGPNCSKPCRCTKNGKCDGTTGACTCNPGYRGNTCAQTCTKGFFGQGCAQKCTCQHNANCNPVDGSCTCTSGYYGSECQYQCLFGAPSFKCGIGCNRKCTCNSNNGVCDPISCGCSACHAGWRGTLCNSKCQAGRWGINCANKCNCKNGATCNPVDGTCSCTAGWKGTDCGTKCASNQWGANCINTCNCQHGTCNRVDGSCSCDPGWAGSSCAVQCKNGFYGRGCTQSCPCDRRYVQNPNAICDPVNGTCFCITGYTGICDTTCPKGKWGSGCTQTCSCVSQNSIGCNQQFGTCDCMPGFGGTDCGTACQQGRWGVNCKETCACHSHGSTCDRVTGTCNCNAGWTGATCAFQCPNGTWGVNCANKCACSIGGCDGVTGTCICPAGWSGPFCNQTCPTGMFGLGCTQACSCVNGTCDPSTGQCSCNPGFTGSDCGQVCAAGKFGAGCSQTCPSCQNALHATGSCHAYDGSCVCQDGWAGALCQDSCPDGKWGPDCTLNCNCNGNGPCNGTTGACMCNAGFTGPTCNMTCPKNSFGLNCQSICQCFNNATCRATDGFCSCQPGYWGPSCLSSCPPNHYGAHCLKTCNCSSTGTCMPTDGSCACNAGYTGSTCATVLTCPAGFFGAKCDSACRCMNGTCNVADGTCSCDAGFQGVICEEQCKPGTYGAGCSKECACKNKATCSNTDGSCTCLPGWLGALCDEACRDGYWGQKCTNTCVCEGAKPCDKSTGECPAVVESQSDSSSTSDTVKIVVPIVCVLVGIMVIILLAVWYVKRSVESKMPPGVYTAEADDITFSSPGAGGLENPTYAEASGHLNATYIPDDKVEENPLAE